MSELNNSVFKVALENLRTQPAPYTVLALLIVFCSYGLATLPSEHRVFPLIATVLAVATILVFLFRQEREGAPADSNHSKEVVTKGISIAGHWEMRDWRNDWSYKYPSVLKCKKNEIEARERTNCVDVEFKQNNATAACGFAHRDKQGRMVKYELTGQIKDLVFTGTWREIAGGPQGTSWFGTFQFIIEKSRDEKVMLGRWTGTDSDEKIVNSGVWEWRERPAHGVPSTRTWPSEAAPEDFDLLRRRVPDVQDFLNPKPNTVSQGRYDELFWDGLGQYPDLKVAFEKAGCDWNALASPQKEICIWLHNNAVAVLEAETSD